MLHNLKCNKKVRNNKSHIFFWIFRINISETNKNCLFIPSILYFYSLIFNILRQDATFSAFNGFRIMERAKFQNELLSKGSEIENQKEIYCSVTFQYDIKTLCQSVINIFNSRACSLSTFVSVIEQIHSAILSN